MNNDTLIKLVDQFDNWLVKAIEAIETNGVATQEILDDVKASLSFHAVADDHRRTDAAP